MRLSWFGSTEVVTWVLVAEIPCIGNHAPQNKVTNEQNPSVSAHNIPVLARSGIAELWLNCKHVRLSGIAGLLINILLSKTRACPWEKNPKPQWNTHEAKTNQPTQVRCCLPQVDLGYVRGQEDLRREVLTGGDRRWDNYFLGVQGEFKFTDSKKPN